LDDNKSIQMNESLPIPIDLATSNGLLNAHTARWKASSVLAKAVSGSTMTVKAAR
jgi:hypothetical protein